MANFLRCVWYYVSFLGLAGATRTESRERNVATEQHDVGANSPTAHTQPSLLERSPHHLGRPVKLTDINTHLTHLACAHRSHTRPNLEPDLAILVMYIDINNDSLSTGHNKLRAYICISSLGDLFIQPIDFRIY